MAPLDFDYVKARFDAEHARAKSLSDSLTFPIGVLTAVGRSMGRSFTYRPGPTRMAFLIVGAGAAVAFIVAVGYLLYAWHRQELALMQTLGDLAVARQKFRQAAVAAQTAASAADAEFQSFVETSMIEATDINIVSNDRRAAALSLAGFGLSSFVLLTGVVGIPYVVDQATAPRQGPSLPASSP